MKVIIRVRFTWVAVCLAVVLVAGCSDSPTTPGSSDLTPDEMAIARAASMTPRADVRAEQMAALYSDGYVATDEMYKRIGRDLKLIEQRFPHEIAQVMAAVPFRGPAGDTLRLPFAVPWRSSTVTLYTGVAYADSMASGLDSGFNRLCELFGAESIRMESFESLGMESAYVSVRLRGNWNMRSVLDRFVELRMVDVAWLYGAAYLATTTLMTVSDNGTATYIVDGLFADLLYSAAVFEVDRKGLRPTLVGVLTERDFERARRGIDSLPSWFTETRRTLRLEFDDAGDYSAANPNYEVPE